MKKLFSHICVLSLIISLVAAVAPAQETQNSKMIDRSKISEMLPKEFAGGALKGNPMALRYASDGGLVNEASGKYTDSDGEIVVRLKAIHSTVPTELWKATREALAGESKNESGSEITELRLIGGYPAQIKFNQSAKQAEVTIAFENGVMLTAKVSDCENSQTAIDTCSTLDLDGWNGLK